MNKKALNSFSALHPLVTLLYFAGMITASMLFMNPVILATSLSGSLCFLLFIEDKKDFLSDLFFYLPMIIIVALVNPLFSHKGVTPLFFMNGNPVTLEALLYGFDIGLMLASVVCLCKCYSKIMTTDKFLFLFGKIAKKLSLIISMAVRFIPLFKESFSDIRQSQISLGLYSKGGFINKLYCELKVFSALVTRALEDSADTAASMNARGYGLKGRTAFSLYKFKRRDLLYILLMLTLFALFIAGAVCGVTDFSFYPHIGKINWDFSSIAVYLSFFVISFLPFITEAWEVTIWKLSVSRA